MLFIAQSKTNYTLFGRSHVYDFFHLIMTHHQIKIFILYIYIYIYT